MRSPLLVAITLVLALYSFPGAARAQTPDDDLHRQVLGAVRGYTNFTIFDDVSVAVSDRAVTLTGRVTMPFKRNDLGARVAKIDGVRHLVNDIQVLPVSIGDSRLRTKIAQAIYGNSTFWHYASMVNPPIHIVVEHSRVTLTGCVNGEIERTLAYALAQVDGVMSVTNELRLDKANK
ncbi:MAG TPA: BON domain-containing protein [Vicinamibacterales bacterium]|nr:BON domain-containing protein [Vicinamibacterales bacterium]